MKRYVFSALAFCLIIGFQNCSQNRLSDVHRESDLSNPAEVTPLEKLDVAETHVIEVPESAFLESQLGASIQQSKPTSSFSSHHLAIDVQTGVISVLDQNDEKVDGIEFCLSANDQQELQQILQTAQICEDKSQSSSQMNCSMEYRFPYAKLHFDEVEVALGESVSGCHSGPDLCGQHKDMLQGFLAAVQNNLQSKVCAFKVVSK